MRPLWKGAIKAYALLRMVLEKTSLAGVSKVVIRPPREHLAALKSLDGAMSDRWDATKYHDEYRESLMQLIEQKIKTEAKKLPAPAAAKTATPKVIDLVSLLQKSINESEKAPKRKPSKRAHRAPHRKAA